MESADLDKKRRELLFGRILHCHISEPGHQQAADSSGQVGHIPVESGPDVVHCRGRSADSPADDQLVSGPIEDIHHAGQEHKGGELQDLPEQPRLRPMEAGADLQLPKGVPRVDPIGEEIHRRRGEDQPHRPKAAEQKGQIQQGRGHSGEDPYQLIDYIFLMGDHDGAEHTEREEERGVDSHKDHQHPQGLQLLRREGTAI